MSFFSNQSCLPALLLIILILSRPAHGVELKKVTSSKCELLKLIDFNKYLGASDGEIRYIFRNVSPEGESPGESVWYTTSRDNDLLKIPNAPDKLNSVVIGFHAYKGKIVQIDYQADGVPSNGYFANLLRSCGAKVVNTHDKTTRPNLEETVVTCWRISRRVYVQTNGFYLEFLLWPNFLRMLPVPIVKPPC
jgi:hypothetical protein